MTYRVAHYIDGKPVFGDHEKTLPVFNPAEGSVIGNTAIADEKSCNLAVSAAHEAFQSWSATSYLKRAKIFFNFRELVLKNQTVLAELVTREHGKSTEDAIGSITRGIEVIEQYCAVLTQMQGVMTPDVVPGVDCTTIRQPLGVCVGISPFNFPVMVPVWMMIPAIACGNTFVLKPSEQTPSAALLLVELLTEAGLPTGVVNCVQGNKTTVDCLISHPQVAAVTAVASTAVAESIYQKAIAHGKRAHTFGSAKNHAVVMPDADMHAAAQAIVGAAYGSAGERCMALSVVVAVGEDTGDAFVDAITPLIRAIRIDKGESRNCEMGPLISAAHKERVISAITKGVQEGARLLIDGRAFENPQLQGYFMGPSFFDAVNESMALYQEEIFGPVLALVRVATLDAALELVNAHQYGNGTAIFTRDGGSARTYSHRVNAGMVGINIPIPVPIASHAFGGWKRSSFGDTSMHGMESIHFYTRLKSITSKWPVAENRSTTFTMPTNAE